MIPNIDRITFMNTGTYNESIFIFLKSVLPIIYIYYIYIYIYIYILYIYNRQIIYYITLRISKSVLQKLIRFPVCNFNNYKTLKFV